MTEPLPGPLLAMAFRPFFILAALWALLSMGLWLAWLLGAPWMPLLGPAWHAHEMLFAVVGAAAAGFLLTAVATWTGTPPVAGWPLAALLLIWLAGRVTLLLEAVPWQAAAAVNLLFFPAVCLALLGRLIPAGNRRNYPLAAILLLLTAAQAWWYLAPAGLLPGGALAGTEAGMLAVAALISLIGGRITPAFTRNWLAGGGRPATVRDHLALEVANVGLLIVASITLLAGAYRFASVLVLAAALAGLIRLAGWQGIRVLREPLLWVLHLAWFWLLLALLLQGLAGLGAPVAATLWWHVLGAGAIGTILIGVMSRVSLGHTGRPLALPRGGVWLYVLISIAALARIAAAASAETLWLPLVSLAAAAWMAAWLGFLLLFGPILLAPRPDGRPG